MRKVYETFNSLDAIKKQAEKDAIQAKKDAKRELASTIRRL